jgi:hypothetical protein
MTAPALPDRPSGTTAAARPLLTRLTVALSRRRAYPETHPLVVTAEGQALDALAALLVDRPRVTFSLGADALLIDEEPVEHGGAVARELGDRLRERSVASLSFDRGVAVDALREVLAWLSADSVDEPPALTAARITRIAYGRLTLGEGDDADEQSAAGIWRALASVALLDEVGDGIDAPATDAGHLAGPDAGADTTPPALDAAAPADIARAIERRVTRDDYARRVSFVLLRVAEQVTHADDAQRAVLAERLHEVLRALRESSAGAIIKASGVAADQHRFIAQMIDALPPHAIIEWMETAAQAGGHVMSHQLRQLLAKLSIRAERADRSGQAAALRGVARDVVRGWTLDAAPTDAHLTLLDRLSRLDATGERRTLPSAAASAVVQMALEINVFGEDAVDAAGTLLADGRVADLMAWEREAAPRAGTALHAVIVSPSGVRQSLLRDPLDHAVARALLASLDVSAAEALLEVLRDAEQRATRRLVYDRLREFGPALAPTLKAHLEGAPWYLVRNLLALLRDTASTDAGSGENATTTLYRYLDHDHEQVRVEALRLMLADTVARDAAIRRVLADPSDRVLRLALEALTNDESESRRPSLSPDLAQRLCAFIETGAREEALRVRAVRALGDAPASLRVRDLLLSLTTKRSRMLRRVALADESPLMIAALESLARRFATEPKCAPVVELAASHGDARIREAIARGRARARTVAA